MNFTAHLLVSLALSVVCCLTYYSYKNHTYNSLFILVSGISAGVLIDVDHFIWARLYFGNWGMLKACVFDFTTCLTDVSQAMQGGYSIIQSVDTAFIGNVSHAITALLFIGAAYIVGKRFQIGLKLALVVFLTTFVHILLDLGILSW